jgi:membrane-associated phospholipid phosphatase
MVRDAPESEPSRAKGTLAALSAVVHHRIAAVTDFGRHAAVACMVCWLLPSVTAAQSDPTTSKTFFTERDALWGTGMFAASATLSLFDARIAKNFEDSTYRHVRAGRVLDNVFTHINETTLTVGGLTVYAIGRVFKWPTVSDVSLHLAESVAAASITSQMIRGPLGRTRPSSVNPQFSDQYNFQFMKGFTNFQNRAFPSIHSSSGFAAASALTAEVNIRHPSATWSVGVPAYLLAITPGLSRMYLGQHWASDILAGAVIGTFYGWRIVQYSHAHARTPVDRLFLHSTDDAEVSTGRLRLGWTTQF